MPFGGWALGAPTPAPAPPLPPQIAAIRPRGGLAGWPRLAGAQQPPQALPPRLLPPCCKAPRAARLLTHPTHPSALPLADYATKYDLVLSSGFLAFANHCGFLQAGARRPWVLHCAPTWAPPCTELRRVPRASASCSARPLLCPMQWTTWGCLSTASWAPLPGRSSAPCTQPATRPARCASGCTGLGGAKQDLRR